MKKKLLVAIATIAAISFVLLLAALFVSDSTEDLIIPIDNMKLNDEYVYDGIPWGTPLEEVEEMLPYNLERFEIPGLIMDETYDATSLDGLVDFRAGANLILGGYSSHAATFKFEDGKFVMVGIHFKIGEGHEKWFEEQIDKLTELYGKESHITENDKGGKVVRWDTEMTSLQIGSFPKDSSYTEASFVVFYRY